MTSGLRRPGIVPDFLFSLSTFLEEFRLTTKERAMTAPKHAGRSSRENCEV